MGLEFSTEQFSTAQTAPVVAGLFPNRPGRAGPGRTAGLLTRSCQPLAVFLGDVVRVLRLYEDCPEKWANNSCFFNVCEAEIPDLSLRPLSGQVDVSNRQEEGVGTAAPSILYYLKLVWLTKFL